MPSFAKETGIVSQRAGERPGAAWECGSGQVEVPIYISIWTRLMAALRFPLSLSLADSHKASPRRAALPRCDTAPTPPSRRARRRPRDRRRPTRRPRRPCTARGRAAFRKRGCGAQLICIFQLITASGIKDDSRGRRGAPAPDLGPYGRAPQGRRWRGPREGWRDLIITSSDCDAEPGADDGAFVGMIM